MSRLARWRIARSGVEVDQRLLGGEELPFADGAFNCVVGTWTLCSIPEVGRAMSEVYRVLKPGGCYLFLEHGLSAIPKIQKWQKRLTPLQRRLAEGCRLDLDVEAVVRGPSFGHVQIERFVMEKMSQTHGTMYRGMAIK
jgi:SAM-dependent methyltransferase